MEQFNIPFRFHGAWIGLFSASKSALYSAIQPLIMLISVFLCMTNHFGSLDFSESMSKQCDPAINWYIVNIYDPYVKLKGINILSMEYSLTGEVTLCTQYGNKDEVKIPFTVETAMTLFDILSNTLRSIERKLKKEKVVEINKLKIKKKANDC